MQTYIQLIQQINMRQLKPVITYLIFILVFRAIHSEAPPTEAANPSTLTSLQQRIISLIGGPGIDQVVLLKFLQSSGILQIFTQIPQNKIDSLFKQLKSGFLSPNPPNYNPFKNFTNWGETFDINLLRNLYPTECSPYKGQQIQSIIKFVKNGVKNGKRVRGSGCRHSQQNIFSDPNELLVSFYPRQIIDATSQTIDKYTKQVTKLQQKLTDKNIEHLNQIRKVGDINVTVKQNGKKNIVKRHLVKIGAGVSINQLRLWSKKNGYQYKSSPIVVEANFVGALSTCSHSSGINTQTLCDQVYEIEFIDYKGNRHTISKANHPQLIKTAASSLGLLGLVLFVTIEMEDLQIVKTSSRITYKDLIIPWPKDYVHQKKRLQRPEWKQWVAANNPTSADTDWENNFNKFKQAISQTYCEWYYFPIQGVNALEIVLSSYAPKTPQNVAKIFANKDVFIDEYPPPQALALSGFFQFLANYLINDLQTQSFINTLMKNPFQSFPQNNLYINYPDAIHYLRGLNNLRARSFQVLIDIPAINCNGKSQPDYNLIQRLWWSGLEIAEKNSDIINVFLEMRIIKGSEATLAPQMGFDYVCSLEIVRTLPLTKSQQKDWNNIMVQIFNAWKNNTDSKGNKVTIRLHWGKEWNSISAVKSHVLSDKSLQVNIRKFLSDYQKIAKFKGFDYLKNLQTFSNKPYREVLNSAIGKHESKIK